MSEILRKGIISLSSLAMLTSCFVLSPMFENSAGAAWAQAKKQPAKKKPQQRSGPNLNTAEVNNYLSRLRDKLDQFWELADGRNHVTLTMTMGQDGIPNDIAVTSSPSNQSAEQAANEAFAKAQPMESLPPGAGEKVKLTIVFDSFADPHGDSNRNIKTQMDPVAATPKTE
jgi:glucose/arabinose dehydrogenase